MPVRTGGYSKKLRAAEITVLPYYPEATTWRSPDWVWPYPKRTVALQRTELDVVVINQQAARAAGNQQLFNSLAGHWERCKRAMREKGAQE
jgi:hypothetical protein